MALHSSRFIPLFRRGAVVSTLSVFVILLLFPFKTVVFVILVHSISQSLIYKRLIVTFYGNYKESHKNAVMKMMQKLNETGRNVPIPWLRNRKLEVRFK